MDVPAATLEADAPTSSESYTLLVHVDDYAGQASFLLYADHVLTEAATNALELMNGRCFGGSGEAQTAEEAFALAWVVALNDSGLRLDAWIPDEDWGTAGCPDQTELEAGPAEGGRLLRGGARRIALEVGAQAPSGTARPDVHAGRRLPPSDVARAPRPMPCAGARSFVPALHRDGLTRRFSITPCVLVQEGRHEHQNLVLTQLTMRPADRAAMTPQTALFRSSAMSAPYVLLLALLSVGCGDTPPATCGDAGPDGPPLVGSDAGTDEFTVLCSVVCADDARPTDDYCSAASVETCWERCISRLAAAPDPNELCTECLLEDAQFGVDYIAIPLCEWNDECGEDRCDFRGCVYCESEEAAATTCREAMRQAVECELELGRVGECADVCG